MDGGNRIRWLFSAYMLNSDQTLSNWISCWGRKNVKNNINLICRRRWCRRAKKVNKECVGETGARWPLDHRGGLFASLNWFVCFFISSKIQRCPYLQFSHCVSVGILWQLEAVFFVSIHSIFFILADTEWCWSPKNMFQIQTLNEKRTRSDCRFPMKKKIFIRNQMIFYVRWQRPIRCDRDDGIDCYSKINLLSKKRESQRMQHPQTCE